jgi:hypothetical protein
MKFGTFFEPPVTFKKCSFWKQKHNHFRFLLLRLVPFTIGEAPPFSAGLFSIFFVVPTFFGFPILFELSAFFDFSIFFVVSTFFGFPVLFELSAFFGFSIFFVVSTFFGFSTFAFFALT